MSLYQRFLFGLGAALALASAPGCSKSTKSRERADAGAPRCPTALDALRIWNFNLSHPDTVTLKNLGECPLLLEGIELLFDDRDDAFTPETRADCTTRLPAVTLGAGATLRVSELPFPGEIDALANEVSGCSYPLAFNPDRGGVTYLCDGPCGASTLIDMVAHAGDDIDALEPGTVENRYRQPSELRFGARFTALRGAGKFNDGMVRYQRVANEGRYPDYRSSDWGLQSRVVYADFEEGITARNVASLPTPFDVVPGRPAEFVTNRETSTWLATSLRITHVSEDGVSDALRWPLDAFSVPSELSYFARTSSPAITGNLALLSGSNPMVELGFEPDNVGANHGSGERAQIQSNEDQWYHIELRDIDWEAGRFDVYVDGIPVGLGLEIPEDERSVDELRVYGVTGGSTAYVDMIELWGHAYATNDPEGEGDITGVLRCGVTGGDGAGGAGGEGGASGVPPGPVCEDVDGPSATAATCETFCADWNRICCSEPLAENYRNQAECLDDCATFSAAELCCRAYHGSVGGPERCPWALGVDRGDLPAACAD
jgi:hypothetical protein